MGGGFGKFNKDEEEKKEPSPLEQVDEEGPQSFAVKDNYDGNIDNQDEAKDEKTDKKKEEADAFFNDDFLADLKAVDVPDSDDECFF
jgi:hypothetical protein